MEVGYATPDQIDTGIMLGCRMPAPFTQIAEIGVVQLLLWCEKYGRKNAEVQPCQLLRTLASAEDPASALQALREGNKIGQLLGR